MEQTRKMLMTLYIGVIAVAIAMIALYELDLFVPGAEAGRDNAVEFVLTTIMELATLACAYLALRLFKFQKVHDDLTARKEAALRKWGVLRLALLGVPLLANTLLYYLYMNPTFGYMAIILALCLPFVFPGKNRCEAEVSA